MATRVRRTFSDEFKQQLMDELKGGKKLKDVAAAHGIAESQISQWKTKMGYGKSGGSKTKAKASTVSAAQPNDATSTASNPSTKRSYSTRSSGNASHTTGSSSSIEELERMIGQLSVENFRLKRELGK